MSNKLSDLLSIANPKLAKKLARDEAVASSKTEPKSKTQASETNSSETEHTENNPTTEHRNPDAFNTDAFKAGEPSQFQRDVWRAVYALNLFRYGLGLLLLILIISTSIDLEWRLVEKLAHPKLMFYAAITLLCSGIVFTSLSQRQSLPFNALISSQFCLDLLLAGVLTHASGGIESNWVLLYFAVVATGSVVLPRKLALALASAAIIVLFAEHFYAIWLADSANQPDYDSLARYGILLFISGGLISYLAQQIRTTELKKFTPGSEGIEDYLMREEVNALKAALHATNGNKTEAAKLLGISFRSFRYKINKHGIG